MDKSQYLNNLGFNLEEWTVLAKEDCEPLIGKEQHMNNMYAINDPSGKKAFGKGAMIVKLEWMDKYTEKVTPPIPPAPTPPAFTTPIIEEVKPIALSEFLKVRLMNMIDKGWVDTGLKTLTKNATEFSYEMINNMDNEDYKKCIVVELPKIGIDRVSFVKSLGMEFNDAKKSWVGKTNTGKTFGIEQEKFETCTEEVFEEFITSVSAYIKENTVEPSIDITEAPVPDGDIEAMKKVQAEVGDIIETVGIPKENVIIASVPEVAKAESIEVVEEVVVESKPIQEPVSALEIATEKKLEEFKEEVKKAKPKAEPKITSKTEIKKEVPVVEEKEELTYKAPKATKKVIKNFSLVDELTDALTLFKKQQYAIASIKDITIDDDITEEYKILLIINLIDALG